jgi:hypothetical protein
MKKMVSKIGVCGFCIRSAFRAVLVSLGCLIAAWLSGSHVATLLAVSTSAILLTLWLVHVVVFAARAAIREAQPRESSQDLSLSHRRQFLREFVRAGTSMAAFTALSPVTTAAFAQNNSECLQNCANVRYACYNACRGSNISSCQSQCDSNYSACIQRC